MFKNIITIILNASMLLLFIGGIVYTIGITGIIIGLIFLLIIIFKYGGDSRGGSGSSRRYPGLTD